MREFTDGEAKEMYCPMGKFARCMGRECMWWKWTERRSKRELPGGGFVVVGSKGKCGRVSD